MQIYKTDSLLRGFDIIVTFAEVTWVNHSNYELRISWD